MAAGTPAWSQGSLKVTINGGTALREWVDDRSAQAGDLDAVAGPDEAAWVETRQKHLIY